VSEKPEADDARAQAAADERLRQFLQWRVETGRAPRRRRMTGKDTFYTGVVGLAAATVVASALIVSLAPAPRSAAVGPVPAAVTQPPVAVSAEPSPRREAADPPPPRREAADEKVAAVESVPELPPRRTKRADTPLDRRPRLPTPMSDALAPPPPAEGSSAPGPPAAADPITPAPSPPISQRSVPGPVDSRLETLKWLVGYIPEVWLARKVTAWVKTQPPPDGASPPAPEVIQAR
jgi:hypothetical protein